MLDFVVKIPIEFKDLTMPDSKHQDEGFKVVDRRLFTAEGDLREGAVEQERRDEEAAASRAAILSEAQAKAAAKDAAAHDNSSSETAPGAAPAGGELAESGGNTDTVGSSRSFQMLVDFLTRNAAAMMGGMADPQTGQPFVDLEGAREVIDMIDALREKTRGNLGKADDDLLIEVLGSLKLTFMEISKAAAAAMAKKAGQKK
jgi:Domain of unknown function (DUF1844)